VSGGFLKQNTKEGAATFFCKTELLNGGAPPQKGVYSGLVRSPSPTNRGEKYRLQKKFFFHEEQNLYFSAEEAPSFL